MRWIALLAAAGLVGVARPVLTAPAGVAIGGVSGYRISNVSYDVDATRVAGVSFALVPAHAATVRARIGSSWSDCSVRRGRATCRFAVPLPRLEDVERLEVSAAG